MSNYTLYGTEFSLYTGKARAYLNYKNIPYQEVLSTAKVYKDIIVPKTGVKFIPVVKTPDEVYLQDTSNIIDHLEEEFPDKPVYPITPKQRLVALLLELYGDEWLLTPAMHYRWNHNNFPFIYQEFGRIVSPKMPGFIRGFLGKKIASRFKGAVTKLGITEKTIAPIENWYENQFLTDLNLHFSEHPFLLGGAPSIADFGFFGPLYAHLYRDPYPGELTKKLAPQVVEWIERMIDASKVEGDLLEGDEIPDTLYPILKHLFDQFWPILEDTSIRLAEWCDRETNGMQIAEPIKVPRILGTHRVMIEGVEEERMVLPYTQWMMQRPLNYYHSLETATQRNLEPLLKSINGLYAMRFNLKHQLLRVNNQYLLR